ncbi:MAG TPA: hypothetical protein DCR43_03900 [Bacteroidales bacterium]|nr:MAG: hypothetical protein A2X11_00595 [Bacteroidetes bacterium GWE2_42_24]OFY27534.1 MAG: hypothetical protein A2X09_07630 [Bacteroidetes bacterium GWF2_43_11]HAQ64986.1 hypothetical protein [Bacteroidales bacterium]HBZ66057.1 hypothetical protein [Bacteroidales bacterium]
MNLDQLEKSLLPFMPEGTAGLYCSQIAGIKSINFKLTRERTSKHGDYRSHVNRWRHQISINSTLPPHHFLVTLLHETAHLLVHERYRNHGDPHGPHWKAAFAEIILPWVVPGVLPPKLAMALKNHIEKGYATTTGDAGLLSVFRELEGIAQSIITLETLPPGAVFAIQGQLFRKGEKMRTFYRCVSLTNNREYRVRITAEVMPIDES